MEALASRRAPTPEEVSANVLSELASVLAEQNVGSLVLSSVPCYHCGERDNHSINCEWNTRDLVVDLELVQALRDGAGALRLEVIRNTFPPSLRAVGVGEGLRGYDAAA